MQPTPENVDSMLSRGHASQTSSKTPNESRSKLKRAQSNVESPSPRVKYGRQTNGKPQKRDLFEFHGSSDGEVETGVRSGNLRGRHEQSSGVRDRSNSNKRKALSIFAEFAKPNQSRLPGKAISPNPGFSSIQASLSDVVSHGSDIHKAAMTEVSPYLQGSMPAPSIPLKGSGINIDPSSYERTSNNVQTNAIVAQPTLPTAAMQEEPSSSASYISPSKTIVIKIPSPKQGPLQYDEMEDELSGSASVHLVSNRDPAVLLPYFLETSENLHSDREALGESEDEVRTSQNRKRKATVQSSPDELGSDEISVGLPQEVYSKRPTRSRSGRGDGELVVPADFSKKPEVVAKVTVKRKGKLKRSKTTAFQELLPVSDDEEDKENNPIDRDIAPVDTSNSKRSAAQKILLKVESEISELDGPVEDDSKTQQEPEAQKSGKKRGRPKKGKAMDGKQPSVKAADVELAEDLAEARSSDQQNGIEKQKVRKDAASNMVFEDSEDHNDDDGASDRKGALTKKTMVAPDDTIVMQTTGNATPAYQLKDATKPASSPSEIKAAPETPKKVEKAPVRGPDQHSPISNGKVKYRVGLSKRARIEPLLRIVRK